MKELKRITRLFILVIPLNIFFLNLGISQEFQKGRGLNKKTADVQLIEELIEQSFQSGSIIFKKNANVGKQKLLNCFEVSPNSTFELEKELNPKNKLQITEKYTQTVNGVPVLGRGYTIKYDVLPDGTKKIRQISPRIESSINQLSAEINISEILEKNNISNSRKTEKFITNAFTDDYISCYKVFSSNMTYWLNAHTGEVLEELGNMINLDAQTEDYGIMPMEDSESNGTFTLESADGKLKTYDYNQLPSGQLNSPPFNPSLIPSTTDSDWLQSGVDPSVFQAHYIAYNIINEFSSLGIDLNNVHIAANLKLQFSSNVGVFLESNTDESWMLLETFDLAGVTTNYAEYDVIGHELGHVFINDYLEYIGESSALHEGLADIFGVYSEYKFQELDWQIAEEVSVISLVRDLEYNLNCYNPQQTHHFGGEPLGHWFYLLADNDPPKEGITPILIDDLIILVKDAITMLSDLDGYHELRDEVLALASQSYGYCSIEYQSIANAWNQICVYGEADAPQLNSYQIVSTCPDQFVYLDQLFDGEPPSGSSLIWTQDLDE